MNNLSAIRIPQGMVKQISKNGVLIWTGNEWVYSHEYNGETPIANLFTPITNAGAIAVNTNLKCLTIRGTNPKGIDKYSGYVVNNVLGLDITKAEFEISYKMNALGGKTNEGYFGTEIAIGEVVNGQPTGRCLCVCINWDSTRNTYLNIIKGANPKTTLTKEAKPASTDRVFIVNLHLDTVNNNNIVTITDTDPTYGSVNTFTVDNADLCTTGDMTPHIYTQWEWLYLYSMKLKLL